MKVKLAKRERMLGTRVIEVPIIIPTGSIASTKIHKNVPLTIAKTVFLPNLIEIKLGESEVILVMDWLAMFKDKIDCEKKKVDLRSSLSTVVPIVVLGKPRNI